MASQDVDIPFLVERIGVIMDKHPEDANEAWGVLNPGCARSRSGELLLFPRVVAAGNYSRIGTARVLFDIKGDPCGIERLGYALEPTESYERNPYTAGCEDPRITYLAELDTYLMTYTAHGPTGPRVALAASEDLMEWRRLGVVKFGLGHGVDFDFYSNKDAVIFPELLIDPQGELAIGLLHRPTYRVSHNSDPAYCVIPDGVAEDRPSIWLSYCPVGRNGVVLEPGLRFSQHRLVATPQEPWQALKIGGGTPPVRTKHGWLTLFHGVRSHVEDGRDPESDVCYCAGALVLDAGDPTKVLYRSRLPILEPTTVHEREGMVANVVFPTAIDLRDEHRLDVYYGMADSRVGVGRLSVPEWLEVARDATIAA